MFTFVEGLPERIDEQWFLSRYAQKFSSLLDKENASILTDAIDSVYTMFYGVQELWSIFSEQVRYDKVRMTFGLLTAWYICDLFPDMADGVITSTGIPLKSKSIANLKLVFGKADKVTNPVGYRDNLSGLNSNPYGAKALMMINGCPEMLRMHSGV